MQIQLLGTPAPCAGMLSSMSTPRVLRYVVFAQDGAFVAQCLDIDVASEGDTEDQAVASLTEALELRLEGGAIDLVTDSRTIRFGEVTINA